MKREVVVVAAGAPMDRQPCFEANGFDEAIRTIAEGDADCATVSDGGGSVLLMERNVARRMGRLAHALICEGEEKDGAEEFGLEDSLCAAVTAAARSIFERHLPAGPGRLNPRPWLSTPRLAQVQGAYLLLLSETGDPVSRPVTTFAERSPRLFLFSADNPDDLVRQVSALRVDLPLPKLAAACRTRCDSATQRFGLALMARTSEELLREAGLAEAGIARALQSGNEWKTPAGSCFASAPLGGDGVAFVFPGVASPYIGLGAELFAIAPRLLDDFQKMSHGEAARYLHADEIYPRGAEKPTALFSDVVALGECALSISAVLTAFVRDVLGVAPRSALGYSFGEAIMPAALGVWPEPTELTTRLNASRSFRDRLQGPMHAIRECWGISDDTPLRWRSYSARATPAEAFAALKPESHAYLCIINSPEEVVIAGDEDACARVLARLGSATVPVPIPLTMHCEPSRSERAEFAWIHDLPTSPAAEIALFSCAGYQTVSQDRRSLSLAIADGYTHMVDFPRLVRKVYAQGAHIFLEVGGRRSCSTWIEKILRGRPHAAIPCDTQGLNAGTSLLRAIARLFTHRVPMKLQSLDDGV